MDTKILLIAGGLANIEIPKHYGTSEDDRGTWQLYPENQNDITLRISAISVKPKDSTKRICMVEEVTRRAQQNERELISLDDTRCYFQDADKESVEDGDPLIFRYWYLGYENTMFILSATILKGTENSQPVKDCLSEAPAILESVIFAPFQRREKIETPYGAVNTTVQTLDKAPEQKIDAFGPDEKNWLTRQLTLAQRFIGSYSKERVANTFDPKNLDFVFAKWLADKSKDKVNGDFVSEALGAAFGEFLCGSHGMEWVVVTDEYGTAVAVRHPGPGNYMAFVVESVRKRVESRETDFFYNISEMLKHNIENQ